MKKIHTTESSPEQGLFNLHTKTAWVLCHTHHALHYVMVLPASQLDTVRNITKSTRTPVAASITIWIALNFGTILQHQMLAQDSADLMQNPHYQQQT